MSQYYGTFSRFDKIAEDRSNILLVGLSSSLPKLFAAGLDCASYLDHIDCDANLK
jgi:hypothetical protein